LGLPDLEKFGRALQLRWLWHEWVHESKPWVGSDLPCNKADRLLFNASTIVTIGDGQNISFWHNSWLEGEVPTSLAPHLFHLVRRKNWTVQQELHNDAWIHALRGKITTATRSRVCFPLDQNPKHPIVPGRLRHHSLEMDGQWLLLRPISIPDPV
jgi:hypothetical protein